MVHSNKPPVDQSVKQNHIGRESFRGVMSTNVRTSGDRVKTAASILEGNASPTEQWRVCNAIAINCGEDVDEKREAPLEPINDAPSM